MNDTQTPGPPLGKLQIAAITAGALGVSCLLLVTAVLPAEFHVDPTGFGRASGLMRLGEPLAEPVAVAPATTLATSPSYAKPYRSDVFEIHLAPKGDIRLGDQLEYKVRMRPGEILVYTWDAEGAQRPQDVYTDLHGETPVGPANPVAKVIEYRRSSGLAGHGALVAPIDGVHGWFLQNRGPKPMTIRLKLNGFYDLVAPGDYGNEAEIRPVSGAQG